MRRVTPKWRPPLSLVVAAILLTVLALPLAGLFFFRLYENQLVRETEAELIAQGAVIGAVFAQALREAGIDPELLGAQLPETPSDPALGRFRPLEPRLDLARDPVLPPRPDGVPGSPDLAMAAIGSRLSPILAETQATTLAALRLLDARGTVIAGSGEAGLSLAGIEEVRAALSGTYRSVLRQRISDEPAPPLYSISRGTGLRVFVAMPVGVEGRVAGVVYLSRTPGNILRHLYGERNKVLAAALAVIGATLAIGFVSVRVITRPMHELRRRTARIAAGDAAAIAPLKHHGTREMAELSRAFLDMAEKLQARSDAIRTFATHLSHEMKSPLTAIEGAAELLRDAGGDMGEAQKERFLANIAADSQRLNRLLRRLLELARAENTGATGETTTLAEALATLPVVAPLPVDVSGDADRQLAISAENLGIVLANLLDNAACHGASRFTLDVRSENGSAAIRACDDGAGISPNNREKIFEPFFTTRRETGGTGLGLGIVAALLATHRGTVALGEADKKTCFILTLPTV